MFISLLLSFFFLLLSIAYLTLLERHFLGLSQNRLSVNKSSWLGLLQALFDGFKLFGKGFMFPLNLDFFLYFMGPVFMFIVLFLDWNLLDKHSLLWSLNKGFLLLLVFFGCVVYLIMLMSYFSMSKYPMLGSLRSVVQSLSFELVFFFSVLPVVFISGTLFLKVLPLFFFILVFVVLFFFSFVAESGRPPLDLLEAESELVSGYNLEYSSVLFVLIFLGEYGFLFFFSVFLMMFFYSVFTMLFFLFVFLLLRCTYPRLRLDLFFGLFWYLFIPLLMNLGFYFYYV